MNLAVPLTALVVLLLSGCVAAALTGLVRKLALQRGMIDVPNARSSHTRPTPRGGGLAIVATALGGTLLCAAFAPLPVAVLAALLLGGGAVATVGYIDDQGGLPATQRFVVHVSAGALAAGLLGLGNGEPILPLLPTALILCLLWLGVVWSINLFNFMDGIDGIAASQAVFVSGSSAALVLGTHGPNAAVLVLLLTAGACLGFLVWNWPTARIFMGDVGSGFLGFWLASLAILMAQSGSLSLWTSIVLGSLFGADATVTLLRRVIAGETWYEAHRSHAYQHQARRWGSHRPVTLGLWAVNLAVVLPLAVVAERNPAAAPSIAVAVLAVFGAACWMAGAGRSVDTEREERSQAVRV